MKKGKGKDRAKAGQQQGRQQNYQVPVHPQPVMIQPMVLPLPILFPSGANRAEGISNININPVLFVVPEKYQFTTSIKYEESFQRRQKMNEIESAWQRSVAPCWLRLVSVFEGSTVFEVEMFAQQLCEKLTRDQIDIPDAKLKLKWIDGSELSVIKMSVVSIDRQLLTFEKPADLVRLLQPAIQPPLALQEKQKSPKQQFLESLPSNGSPDEILEAFLNRPLTNVSGLEPFQYVEDNDNEENADSSEEEEEET